MITSDDFLSKDIPLCSVDLLISSPPYGIGKSYEHFQTLDVYSKWAEKVVQKISQTIKAGGWVAWQVGNYVDGNGNIFPLDVLFIPLFLKNGFFLRNRIVWKFGHGLHAQKKLSGRYEVLLLFLRDNALSFTFNLDFVREPSIYPGKKAYKGAKKGELSGTPLGKNPSDVWELLHVEWDDGIMEIPPVKNNHVEKEAHPCQFPIELAERCVLLLSNPGDHIFDPFCGVGTTIIAALFHDRKASGTEIKQEFVDIANSRIQRLSRGELKIRKIGTPVLVASESSGTRKFPDEWKEAIISEAKKPRLVETSLQRLVQKI